MRFVEILTLATLITGLIWLIDALFFRKKRIHAFEQAERGGTSASSGTAASSGTSAASGTSASSDSSQSSGYRDPWWIEYSRAFFPILLIVLIIRSFIAEPFRIPSGSMRPTLLEGDFILVNKYDYGLRLPFSGTKFLPVRNPKRGEVIVFKHNKNDESLDLIKRIVGLPGDHIEYKDKVVYVNGQPVKRESQGKKVDFEPSGALSWPVQHQIETLGDIQHDIYTHIEPSRSFEQYNDVVVPENSYFVMGDNRDNSGDSRAFGFVKDEDILGRAMFIWMSWDGSKLNWDCLHHCIRWDRLGKLLQIKPGEEKSGQAESRESKLSETQIEERKDVKNLGEKTVGKSEGKQGIKSSEKQKIEKQKTEKKEKRTAQSARGEN